MRTSAAPATAAVVRFPMPASMRKRCPRIDPRQTYVDPGPGRSYVYASGDGRQDRCEPARAIRRASNLAPLQAGLRGESVKANGRRQSAASVPSEPSG